MDSDIKIASLNKKENSRVNFGSIDLVNKLKFDATPKNIINQSDQYK